MVCWIPKAADTHTQAAKYSLNFHCTVAAQMCLSVALYVH